MNLNGKEFVIIKMGVKGSVSRFEIDTKHFIGNYPESVEVKVLYMFSMIKAYL